MTPPSPSEPARPATGKDAPAGPRLFAVIDVGSTAVRMEIAELLDNGAIHTIEQLHHAVHLGKDSFTLGRIQQSTIEECVNILKNYRRVMEEYGVTAPNQIRAVATSSVREASNRDTFLDRVYIATRINLEVIEEAEETRLTYLGVQDILARHPELQKGDLLVVEVGGGDSELLVVQDGFVTFSNTYRLGSLRMRETLDVRHTPAARLYETFLKHIQLTVDQIHRSVPVEKTACLVAISGDARFAATHLVADWADKSIARIDVKSFSAFARKIASLEVDELVRKYRMSFQEAETVGPALMGYAQLAKVFGVEQFVVPKSSLRHGLLREAIGSGAWNEGLESQLIHSAVSLGHKYSFDERHGTQVADLSVRLFRELQPDHQLGVRHERLLRVAAILHEVGLFIHSRSHHKHSMYIILNSDLFGMSRSDMNLIGLIARYHRRAAPQPYHEGYALLSRDDRMVVSKLAAILRVADALDRNHMQQVRELSFARARGSFTILVHDVEDLSLERVALKEKGSMFEEVYGMKIGLEVATSNEGLMPDV
ncbi:MAG TPA: HD domain-containing protein [Kiritimatiellia bacterium]|nr:HD domain-containing protein [Kiritimatiellia bacterium]HMP34532.1 HD domain-containing protein [Kiritimatiellia bacterium]